MTDRLDFFARQFKYPDDQVSPRSSASAGRSVDLLAAFSASPITPFQISICLYESTVDVGHDELVDTDLAVEPSSTDSSRSGHAMQLTTLPESLFVQILCCVREIAQHIISISKDSSSALSQAVSERYGELLPIKRFALLTTDPLPAHIVDGVDSQGPSISLIPLHGISDVWEPMLAGEPRYSDSDEGYITTCNGPPQDTETLTSIIEPLRAAREAEEGPYDPSVHQSTEVQGDHDATNLFAKLIKGTIPSWRFQETQDHLAFLTPFPNLPGYSVLIPRRHFTSDILAAIPLEAFEDLMRFTWRTIRQIKKGLKTQRVGIAFEGFEIDWAHVKLMPIPPRSSTHDQHIDVGTDWWGKYPGYLTSQPGPTMKPSVVKEMQDVAEAIRASWNP